MVDPGRSTVREVVAVFHMAEDLEAAIDELLSSGTDRAEISLLASEHAVEKKLGHRYERADTMAQDPAVPRTAFVSSAAIGDAEGGLIGGLTYVGATAAAGAVVASGGALAVTVAAALLAGGASGFIGTILARLIDEHHASYLEDQIESGGLLLWVRARDADDEADIRKIMERHSGKAVAGTSNPPLSSTALPGQRAEAVEPSGAHQDI